jgi:hypothetical protein
MTLGKKLLTVIALAGSSLFFAGSLSAQELTFLELSSPNRGVTLHDCSAVEGASTLIVGKRGKRIRLPRSENKKPYRLNRAYRFFACGANASGGESLFVKVSATSPSIEIPLTRADFKPRVDDDNGAPIASCKEFPGSIFKPCICAEDIPAQIKYRPSLPACGGRAAAILEGGYADSFSVVLRDSQNRDRVPAVGYNGCSQAEADLGLSRCSAFKCQSTIRTPGSYTCCFGEAGNSSILAGATRMTIKLADVPNATTDPLLRLCLPGFDPTNSLN